MGLADGDHVLDIGLARAREVPAHVGPVDAPTKALDDLALDGLRVGIVIAIVGRATVLGDDEAAPCLRLRGARRDERTRGHPALITTVIA